MSTRTVRSPRNRSGGPPIPAMTCRSPGGTAASGTPRNWPPPTPAWPTWSGDIDPIKVAEGRSLGDPETIAYGLIPRAHRGIVAVNELPDLAERIQVSMLNVMEERDIQVRGYTLRLPLDVLVVASANPEDYTNRGRIITPLKDRFGAEIRTHYPLRTRRRGRCHRPGGAPGRRGARVPAADPRPVRPQPARVQLRRPAFRGVGALRDRGRRDGGRVSAAPRGAARRAGPGRPGGRSAAP